MLAVIPARGGSKSFPGKNIALFIDKPLIAWTIEAGKRSRYIDRLVVSSDSDQILKVAQQHDCEVPFKRPSELAQDDTPGVDPIIHALENIEGYEYVVMLQPTSPLRIAEDIDQCIKSCIDMASNSTVSVTETEESPYWMYTLKETNVMVPVLDSELKYQRQDLPTTYILNGAVYVAKASWLIRNRSFIKESTRAYLMPRSRSIDIDSVLDLKYAEMVFLSDSL